MISLAYKIATSKTSVFTPQDRSSSLCKWQNSGNETDDRMSFDKTLPVTLGKGDPRCVLLLPGVVVKVPYLFKWRNFLCGLLANMQERQFSRTGCVELCPVLFADPLGFVVVMRRAAPLSEEDWAGFDYGGVCREG